MESKDARKGVFEMNIRIGLSQDQLEARQAVKEVESTDFNISQVIKA